ncbi:MAG: Fe3+-siderophore ABC transporter permease [Methanomassiliicoccales archaeon Mx-03]|nr:MAG: Fe3+-siderophore ABC transporter permease [Methanomassiliicoccales archaeon Mx-03]
MGFDSIDDDRLIGDVVRTSIRRWIERQPVQTECNTVEDYHSYTFRKWAFIGGCTVLLIVLCGISLTIGDLEIGFFESYRILWDHIIGLFTGDISKSVQHYAVVDLRLPKIVVGIIAGVALAICGVAMQSLLKNPLADSYTTGVSSGAGFGATLAIVLGASFATNEFAVIGNAFIFALIPTVAIIMVSMTKSTSPTTMIMAGIAIMYLFDALTTIIKLWGDPDSLAAILEWQVGKIGGIEWSNIPVMLIVTLVGYAIIQLSARKLNVLATGEENAKALGVDVKKLRTLLLALTALLAATIVSYTGVIGFIGLVAPHIARLVIGSDNRYLVPAAAVLGAVLLIAADIVGKTIVAPAVLPVGVVTAFLGAPLFLWLILRSRTGVWH